LRKVFPLILALALVAADDVLSQDIPIGDGKLTLGGKLVSGIFYDSDNVPMVSDGQASINSGMGYYGTEGSICFWNESDSKNSMRLDCSLTYALDDFGFNARLRVDGIASFAYERYAYAWVDLLDDQLKISGGFIDIADKVWGTLGDGDWDIGGNGVRVEITPIEGLNFGAFFMVPYENANPPKQPTTRLITGTVTPERVLRETVFGFRYTNSAFYVSSQLKLDSDIDGLIINSVDTLGKSTMEPWSGADDEMLLIFGAGLTAVQGLTLTAEGNLQGLGNTAARGRTDLRQTASYDFGKLTVGVKAKELLYGYDLGLLASNYNKLSPWMQFKPFVSYELVDDFSVGLEGGYGFGYLIEVTPDSGNDGAGAISLALAREKYDFFIKPNLSLKLNGGLSLKAWYMLTAIGYEDLWDDAAYDDRRHSAIPEAKDLSKVESILMHQLALEFTLRF